MATILVVDDDTATLELLAEILGESQHTILTATNGCEAFSLAQAHQPQLIIADVWMPGMDGYGLVAVIRADPVLAQTPIILMSAGFEQLPPQLSDTAPPFLPKPFDLGVIEGIVRHLPPNERALG